MSRQVTLTELATILGISVSGASRMMKRSKLPMPSVKCEGAGAYQYQIDLEAFLAIYHAHAEKVKLQEAARELGINRQTLMKRATKAGIMVYINPLDARQIYLERADLPALSFRPDVLHPDEDGKRKCTHCYKTLPISEFYDKPSNRKAHCKSCHRVMVFAWRERNPELTKSIQKRSNANRGKQRKGSNVSV